MPMFGEKDFLQLLNLLFEIVYVQKFLNTDSFSKVCFWLCPFFVYARTTTVQRTSLQAQLS